MSEKERFTTPETKRKIVRLDDLIDPNRAVPVEYESLIRAQEQDSSERFQPTAYSETWLRDPGMIETEEERKWFAERLRGRTLIDLGGGQSSMQDFAADYGASTYVCVDRYGQTRESPVDPLHPEQESDPTENLHEIAVKADMLDFISRLKDRSANLTINGVDLFIIGNRDYHEALARELVRVVGDEGIIFGDYSEALKVLNRNIPPELRNVKFIGSDWHQFAFVFERVK